MLAAPHHLLALHATPLCPSPEKHAVPFPLRMHGTASTDQNAYQSTATLTVRRSASPLADFRMPGHSQRRPAGNVAWVGAGDAEPSAMDAPPVRAVQVLGDGVGAVAAELAGGGVGQ
jgi:hypothetical protein